MNTTTDTTAELPAWVEAGRAWGHAPTDWAYLFEPYGTEAIAATFDELAVGESTRLVDIACGSGLAAGRAERRGAIVAGIDASADLIDIAARRAPGAALRVGDMFELPWVDNTFDVATSFNGIWGGCTDALREARRVLRPGGRIGLTFWGPGHALDLRDWFIALGSARSEVADEMITMADIGAPGVVETMLAEAGFDGIERFAAPSFLELPDDETLVRALRSPGLVVPVLEHLGDAAYRDLVLEHAAPFKASDGSYRIANELTCVVAHAA